MADDPDPRAPDVSRRRLIAGLGALGVGALGLRWIGDVMTKSEGVTNGAGPTSQLAIGSTSTIVTPTAPTELVTTSTARVTESTAIAPDTIVTVACRDAWGAVQASGAMTEHTPVRLTLHHTAVSQTSRSQGPARARQHQQYHQSLGWSDLAYHFLVDRTGMVYEGREIRFVGDTGTEYDPTGHVLVCMEGDFDTQEPTTEQLSSTVGLFAWASQQFDIAPSTLAGHQSYAVTSCPGSSVVAMIPDLADLIAGREPVTLERVCGAEGAGLVASIEDG